MSLPRKVLATVSLLVAAGLAGCKVVEETTKYPIQGVKAIMPGSKGVGLNPVWIQLAVQRFADDFTSRTGTALEDYARQIGTEEARQRALSLKLQAATSAYSIASGPNPTANLLDFLAMVSLTRTLLEEYWIKTPEGPAYQAWLETSRMLETDLWRLGAEILSSKQQDDLRAAIKQWREENPAARTAFFARPQEFRTMVLKQEKNKPAAAGGGDGGLLSLLGLDPAAGLDPAVREVTLTRLFAERALFTTQRFPSLLRWQVELLTDEILSGPQIAGALTNATRVSESVDRLSRAAESAIQTVAQLPDRITAERKAVLAALETQEGRLRELSAEVTRTMAAGEKMSDSLNTTLTTFNALMKRFGVGEPAPASAPPPDTNSPPFNILDYAKTADRLALMAKELDAVIKDAGNTLDSPALTRHLQEFGAVAARAKDDAKSVLNHAFLLAIGIVVLVFLGALAYRRSGRQNRQLAP